MYHQPPPNTNQPGFLYVARGNGQNEGKWIPLTDAKDYAVSGALVVPAGAAGFLPPFIYQNAGKLLSVAGKVRAGSIDVDIEHNGVGIAGLTGLNLTNTTAYFSPSDDTFVSAEDDLGPSITSVSGADGLSLSFVFWVYLS